MTTVTLIHNPRCSKSRQALALLNDQGIEPDIRLYLNDALSLEELKAILQKLSLTAKDLVRKKEDLFKSLDLADASEETLIAAMVEHPKLIERPIAIVGNKAVIGRPPEDILSLLP